MSSPEPEEPELPPTRARFVVAAWLCGLSGILYLDRICMGQAVVPIQRELGLSNSAMSLVLMSFTLAYGILAAGWRWVFLTYGALGALWAVGFWFWFRDDPAKHAGVNAAELARIRADTDPEKEVPPPVPWGAVATNRGILVLSAIMVF